MGSDSIESSTSLTSHDVADGMCCMQGVTKLAPPHKSNVAGAIKSGRGSERGGGMKVACVVAHATRLNSPNIIVYIDMAKT